MNPKIFRQIRRFARSGEDGIALPMVILISALLLGFGLALTTNTVMETEISSSNQRQAVAFYAAEMGLERAVNAFRTTFTVNTLPVDNQTIFNRVEITYPENTQKSDYTVTVTRRDSPGAIAPYPIYYTLNCVGRQVPLNNNVQPATVTLQQSLTVTPMTLANWTLFYDEMEGGLSFQNSFKLTGRIAINDLDGVNTYSGTTINGDFYCAGEINRNSPYGVPIVSGNIQEKAGKLDFPSTIEPFSSGAADPYKFTGTTRMIFSDDGTVLVYNSAFRNGRSFQLPSNGLMSVTGGDVIVEGTVKGRVTVAGDDDILINGDIRYADHGADSWDTLALVANGDIIIPTNYYRGTTALSDFEPHWNQHHSVADRLDGTGPWGNALPADVHIDATMVALQGSSPAVINPQGRPKGELYIYGNSIARIASATIAGDLRHGLNEQYMENRKLDLCPPAGFPFMQRLFPVFFSFREVRTPLT